MVPASELASALPSALAVGLAPVLAPAPLSVLAWVQGLAEQASEAVGALYQRKLRAISEGGVSAAAGAEAAMAGEALQSEDSRRLLQRRQRQLSQQERQLSQQARQSAAEARQAAAAVPALDVSQAARQEEQERQGEQRSRGPTQARASSVAPGGGTSRLTGCPEATLAKKRQNSSKRT